ncbi:hypothetical protein [Dictyobacter kobayashii]|nr:hypothetical protein [Dictyobacter kobayashii]
MDADELNTEIDPPMEPPPQPRMTLVVPGPCGYLILPLILRWLVC